MVSKYDEHKKTILSRLYYDFRSGLNGAHV